MEIQDEYPMIPLPLEKIGFRGVKRRIILNTPEGRIALDLDLDITISIGGDRRGAHLSRNIEALLPGEVLIGDQSRSLEDYLEKVSNKLLNLHDYATSAEAKAKTIYYVNISHNGINGVEPVNVEVTVYNNKLGVKKWTVSVTIAGLSVCPSAQRSVKEKLQTTSIAPSHVQRVYLTGRVTTRREMVRIEDITRALAKSFSAPAFTLLKRDDEARLVISAHSNPKFAEDIAREALHNIARTISGMVDPNTIIEVEVDSYESIHPHNVYAYARASLSSLVSSDIST